MWAGPGKPPYRPPSGLAPGVPSVPFPERSHRSDVSAQARAGRTLGAIRALHTSLLSEYGALRPVSAMAADVRVGGRTIKETSERTREAP